MNTANLDGCPAENICVLTELDGPPCGAASDHLDPLSLAEDLCPEALMGKIKEFEETTTKRAEVGLAWAHADLGLCLDVDADTAKNHFDVAEEVAAHALSMPGNAFSRVLQLRQLQTHLGAFHYRRFNHEVAWTDEDHQEITADLAQLMMDAQDAPIHENVSVAHFDEPNHEPCFRDNREKLNVLCGLAVQQFCRFAGLSVWPSSSRERQKPNSSTAILQTNHYGYILGKDDKLPYRTQFETALDARTKRFVRSFGANIALSSVVSHATLGVRHAAINPERLEDLTNRVFELIIAKGRGKDDFSQEDTALLGSMMADVKGQLVTRGRNLPDFEF